jgi:hypothetical protein
LRSRGEGAQALGGKALVGQVERNAHRVVLVQPVGHRGRDEELLQVDTGVPGLAKGGKGAAVVLGVHAAVAVDRQAQAQALVELPRQAELGNEEGLAAVAAVVAVQPGAIALDAGATAGQEDIQAGIQAVADPGGSGGVGGPGQGVLRQRDAGAGHALALDAVAVGEIAVGGMGHPGQDTGTAQQNGQQGQRKRRDIDTS